MTAMRTLGIVALGFSRLIGVVAFALMPTANASNFNPVRSLTTWYTDRTPIDIEVVSSPDASTGVDKFDSKKLLRFRLERAFVHDLLTLHSNLTIVRFGLDMDTGLPDSLLTAASDKGRYQERISDVPIVPFLERLTRTLIITIESDSSAQTLQRVSSRLQKCAGEPTDIDLLTFKVADGSGCLRSAYPGGTLHIAKYDDNLLLQIECHEPGFRGIGCRLRFPFEGFSVEVVFHRNHLSRWREVVDRAASFLKSKQYRIE